MSKQARIPSTEQLNDLLEKVIKYARRHFKRDSFYAYSRPVQAENPDDFFYSACTGVEWIEKFITIPEDDYNGRWRIISPDLQ